MATDKLTDLESAIASTIEACAEGPYFYTWGTVNEPDQSKQEFPSAEVRLMSEECLDENGGASAGAYSNKASYEIVVKASLGNEVMSGTQVYAIDKELNKALSDLKRMFGINYNLGACYTIMYRGMTREMEEQGDLLIPKRMVTNWDVWYHQDRGEPTVSADGA